MDIDIFMQMASKWPSAIIARAEVGRFTGGGISASTLANADSEGTGPKNRFFVGRRVCYPVSSLIEWLRDRSKQIPKKYSHKNTDCI